MQIAEYLDKTGAKYEISTHSPTFSAQRMAAVIHEPGRHVAKPVIMKVDGRFVMCVLAACDKADLAALKRQMGAKSVELASEEEIGRIFPDCELGAEPPLGNLYKMETVMDKSLEQDERIKFQAGTHQEVVEMRMEDYRKLVSPKILDFSYRGL